MAELVKRGNVASSVIAATWEEAIRAAGALLVASGDVEEGYVDQMVCGVKEYGPYIVLAPGFALAHAAPGPAVIRSSTSLINLRRGVRFGSTNDPVLVILCLACTDRSSHAEMLGQIARALMREGAIARLAGCVTGDELYRVVNESLELNDAS